MEMKEQMEMKEMIGYNDPTHPVGRVRKALDEADEVPDLLFVGPPGLGKTTLAHAIGGRYDAEVYEFNASDERGIDMVRTRIKELSTQRSWGLGRLIILDEADGLTRQAQDALRRIIETGNAWFILTANEESSIIPALRSRCMSIKFRPYNIEEIQAFALTLNRAYPVDEDMCERLLSTTGGDLRRVRNLLLMSQNKTELDRHIGATQESLSQASLSLAGGLWGELRAEMHKLSLSGYERFDILRRLHNIIRDMVPDIMSEDEFYAYSSVWGDAVLSVNLWPLDDLGFIDWFVGKVATTARG